MEHKEIPIYVITYNVEMTQFVFADRKKIAYIIEKSDNLLNLEDHIDHSIASRKHA